MRTKGRFNNYIRTIALVLLATFILQDIVYANPDILLKSSAVAQKTLFTDGNKPQAIQRIAKAHFARLASKDPDIMAIEDASLDLLHRLRSLNVPDEAMPSISGEAVNGFVKISFQDGKEIIFHNPELIPSDNSPELLAIFPADKHISSEHRFGRYLCEALVLPGPKKERKTPAKPNISYKTRLKYLIKADSDLNDEIKKAIDIFYHPKSRVLRNIQRIHKIESAASMLNSEFKAGLVSAESLRLAEKSASEAISFKWTNATQKWQIRSFHLHVKKAIELESKKEILLERMPRGDWNTYILPEDASDRDREQYFQSNIQDILIHLAAIVENNPYLDRKVNLKPRILKLYSDIAGWKSLNSDADRGTMLNKTARAFYAISNNRTLGENTNSGFRYIAERCAMLASVLGYQEAAPPAIADMTENERVEQLELGISMLSGSSFGAALVSTSVITTLLGAVTLAFIAGANGLSFYNVFLAFIAIVFSAILTLRYTQAEELNDYLAEGINKLNSIKDSDPLERENIRKLFGEILSVYKYFLIRDLIKKRKELISNLIFSNIIPQPEKGKGREGGSLVRSEEAEKIIMEEVFGGDNPAVFQPALEAVIEFIARYPEYGWKKFGPLLEKSGKLPHFAKALVDVLIRAEKGEIKMLSLEDKSRFIDEGKDILKELSDRLPKVRNDILSYLVTIAEKSDREIELVYNLLERIGFFVTPTEEFPKASAMEVAAAIEKIRAEKKNESGARGNINIVLTGGETMPQFFDYLEKILDKDIWKDIHTYQLCEKKGYGKYDKEFMAQFLDRHLPKDLPAENKHFIDGVNPDPKYIENIEKAGGIDIIVLGIGGNGRLGFNEPSDRFDDNPGILKTAHITDSDEHHVIRPRPGALGYTLPLSLIMKSRNIFLLAEGKNKSKIIKKSLFEPATPQIPASILQEAKSLKVILDMDAMDEVAPTYKIRTRNMVRSLAKAERRTRDLFEDSPAPQHTINRDGMIMASNPAEARMLGYEPGEMIGKYIFAHIYPDDRDVAVERIKQKFAKRQDNLPEVEARYITKDGNIIWVLIKDRQILDGNNNVIKIQSTLTDITRYKVMENELKALKARFNEVRRIYGGVIDNSSGFVLGSPTGIGLLLFAADVAAFAMILAGKVCGTPAAGYDSLFDAAAVFAALALPIIPLAAKPEELSDSAIFAGEVEELSDNINTLYGSIRAVPEEDIGVIRDDIRSLSKRMKIVFAKDADAREFYAKKLMALDSKISALLPDGSLEYSKAKRLDEDETGVSYGAKVVAQVEADVHDLETAADELALESRITVKKIKDLRLDFLALHGNVDKTKHPKLYSLYHGRLVKVSHKLEKLMKTVRAGKGRKSGSLYEILAKTKTFAGRLHVTRKYLGLAEDDLAARLSDRPEKGNYRIDAKAVEDYEHMQAGDLSAEYVKRLAGLARISTAMILFGRPLPEELRSVPLIGKIAYKIRMYMAYSVEEMAARLHVNAYEYTKIESQANAKATDYILHALENMAQIKTGSLKDMIDQGAMVESKPEVGRVEGVLAEPDLIARFNKVAMEYLGYESKDKIAGALGIDPGNFKNRSTPSKDAVARLAELSHIDYGIIYFGKRLNTMLDDVSSRETDPMRNIGLKLKTIREYLGPYSIEDMLEILRKKYGYVSSKRAYAYEEGNVPWDKMGFGMIGYVRYMAKEAGMTPGEILFKNTLDDEVRDKPDAEKFKITRLYIGLTTDEMAERLALPKSTYYAYENGSVKVPAKIMEDAMRIVSKTLAIGVVSDGVSKTAVDNAELYRRFDGVSDLTRNARHVVSLLANILMSQSVKIKGRKIILALDSNLGSTDEIRGFINKYICEAFSSPDLGDGSLKKVFEDLIIIDGDCGTLPIRLNSIIDRSLGKGKEVITKENVVIMTTDSNLEYFKEFEGQSLITAVNDTDLKTLPGADLNYYPIVELIFFSVARMAISGRGSADNYKENLWEWYRSIPNIENINRCYFEELVYDPDGSSLRRTVILKLVPRAKRLGPNEMRHFYERIREFITKA